MYLNEKYRYHSNKLPSISHVGIAVLQFPCSVHTNVSFPRIIYPVSQENFATDW